MNGVAVRQLAGTVAGLVGAGLILPVVFGGLQTALAAFGYRPGIGATAFDLDAWRHLADLPGLATSLRLSLVTGFASTAMALLLAIAFWAGAGGTAFAGRVSGLMTPILSAPHAALAIGLAFLIAPSGWLVRLASRFATGWTSPPDVALVQDPLGLALIFGLVLKELPFLVLVIGAALDQVPWRHHTVIGRALGYGRATIWVKVVLPQVYPQIRLPIYAVLTYALTTVDMAVVLGPGHPPTLAVATMRWFQSPDMSLVLPASAAALLQTLVACLAVAAWWLLERIVTWIGRAWIRRGGRGARLDRVLAAGAHLVAGLTVLGILALAVLVLWSVSWRWRFPDAWPEAFSGRLWSEAGQVWHDAFATTLVVAGTSAALSVLIVVSWLEAMDRRGGAWLRSMQAGIYLPLVLPQPAFVYGLQGILVRVGWDGTLPAVIWVHVLFVVPYVALALGDAWRALDRRYMRVSAGLGRSPGATLMAVKLPLLLRPLLVAAAIGFSVSVGQYLSTLVIGAGRVVTLTTEAVALSSAGDRRIVGTYAALQTFLPLLAFALALVLPQILQGGRKAPAGTLR